MGEKTTSEERTCVTQGCRVVRDGTVVSDYPKTKTLLRYRGAHTFQIMKNVVSMNVESFLQNLSPRILLFGSENLV